MRATVRIDTGDTVIEKSVSDPGTTGEFLAIRALILSIKALDSVCLAGTKGLKYAFKEAFDKEFGEL